MAAGGGVDGVGGRLGTGGAHVVSALELAAADVVLTTYDVLRQDVSRQPELEVQDRALRRGKRCGEERRGWAGWRIPNTVFDKAIWCCCCCCCCALAFATVLLWWSMPFTECCSAC